MRTVHVIGKNLDPAVDFFFIVRCIFCQFRKSLFGVFAAVAKQLGSNVGSSLQQMRIERKEHQLMQVIADQGIAHPAVFRTDIFFPVERNQFTIRNRPEQAG